MSSKKLSQVPSIIVPEFLEMMPQQPMSAYLNFCYEAYGNFWEFLDRNERNDAHSKWMHMDPKAKTIRLRIAQEYKKKYQKDIAEWREHFQISSEEFRAYQKHCTKLKQRLPLIVRKDQFKNNMEEQSLECVDLEDVPVKPLSKYTSPIAKKIEKSSHEEQEDTNFAEANPKESSSSEEKAHGVYKLRSRRKLRRKDMSELEENEDEKEIANESSIKQKLIEELDKQENKTTRREKYKKTIEKVDIEDVSHLKNLISVCFGKSDKMVFNISGQITISLQKSD